MMVNVRQELVLHANQATAHASMKPAPYYLHEGNKGDKQQSTSKRKPQKA